MGGKPVDIVFVIDNSDSMGQEIRAVEQRINEDFADIIEASGVDYRVIMFTSYGSSSPQGVCVGPPLGAGCESPSPVQNPPHFFHYDQLVASADAWCLLLRYYQDGAGGWSEFLRPEAFKSFVLISDEDAWCNAPNGQPLGKKDPFDETTEPEEVDAAAKEFDTALRAMAPDQFGTAEHRTYRFHSIVGLTENPDGGAWPATAALQNETCGSEAEIAGIYHQGVSVLTGGLRYPICRRESFDVVFNALAQDAVATARLACSWKIPEPPAGQSFDDQRVNLEYQPGSGAPKTTVPRVAGLEACDSGEGWYYDRADAPTQIETCPTTCAQLEADTTGEVTIAFGCETIVR